MYSLGIYDSAIYHQKQNLSIKKVYGPIHQDVAYAHYWLGIAHAPLRFHNSAIYHHKQYLSISINNFMDLFTKMSLCTITSEQHFQTQTSTTLQSITKTKSFHTQRTYGPDSEDVGLAHYSFEVAYSQHRHLR